MLLTQIKSNGGIFLRKTFLLFFLKGKTDLATFFDTYWEIKYYNVFETRDSVIGKKTLNEETRGRINLKQLTIAEFSSSSIR